MPISHRAALSPKSSNITTLPGLKSVSSFRSSPLKNSRPDSSPIRYDPYVAKRTKLGFTIFQDEEQVSRYHPVSTSAPSNKQNHGDQENILQPQKGLGSLSDPRTNGHRTPLMELLSNAFPGYVQHASDNALGKPIELLEPFRPTNAENLFGSLHKHSSIPADLTPTKRGAAYLVSSTNAVFTGKISGPVADRTFSDSESEDIDDAESILRRKVALRKPTGPRPVHRHYRSLLVGTNETKLPLITRNGFSILSN